MKYPGKELENFDKATFWRAYIFRNIKKYIKQNILEVGAGIGSFTKNYYGDNKNITLTELDKNNIEILKKKYSEKNNIKILQKKIQEIEESYDTIVHLNVLEHIENDIEEINLSISKLNDKGYLIILVPAHPKLYSKFDEAVGHIRRYEKNFFLKNKFKNADIVKIAYLDSIGFLLYYLNYLFFKDEVYPSKLKIFIWDKIFTPISIILDKLLNYKIGKNILCVYKKN